MTPTGQYPIPTPFQVGKVPTDTLKAMQDKSTQLCLVFFNSVYSYPVLVNPIIFLVHHPHRPSSRELVCSKSSLQCFYVDNRRHTLDRHSGVTLVVVTQCFKNITVPYS